MATKRKQQQQLPSSSALPPIVKLLQPHHHRFRPTGMRTKSYGFRLAVLATLCLQMLYFRSRFGIGPIINLYDFDDDSDSDSNKTNIEEGLVLVHLGKTAGSTITCMLGPSLNATGKGNSQCDYAKDTRPSILSEKVVWRVHLVPAPLDRFREFLITLRNPVDRIVSWYYFVHPDYEPRLTEYHLSHCPRYEQFFRCYQTIQDLADFGLREGGDGRIVRHKTEGAHNHTVTKRVPRYCPDLVGDMIRGKRKCWHNRYNYQYTYGELLEEVTDGHGDGGLPRPTIYAIRTEHLEEDWNTIDTMLGGGQAESDSNGNNSNNNTTPSNAPPPPRKNAWKNNKPNTTLSLEGRRNLCRVLCEEIQIYKGLLRAALNLNEAMEATSLDELLRTCPEESREVRECG